MIHENVLYINRACLQTAKSMSLSFKILIKPTPFLLKKRLASVLIIYMFYFANKPYG